MKPFLKQRLAAAVLLAASAGGAFAQSTSSSIQGVVTSEDGTPIAGSTVTITNTATGLTKTIETSNSGEFDIRGLPVGGNYTIIVTEPGYTGAKTEGLALQLGQTADLNFTLSAATIEEVTVIASADIASNTAVGPNAVFGLETLQTAPAINRNIADVLRADPRIYVNESRGDVNSI